MRHIGKGLYTVLIYGILSLALLAGCGGGGGSNSDGIASSGPGTSPSITLSSSGKIFYNTGTFPDDFELYANNNQPFTQSDTVGNPASSVTWPSSTNSASNVYKIGGTMSDLVFQADVMFTNASAAEGIYLSFRSSDSNSYNVKYGPYYGGILVLSKVVNGGQETHLSGSPIYGLPSSSNTWYKLEFRASGSSLQVYFNDILKLNANDTTFTSGLSGLAFGVYNGSNTWYVDNIKIFKSYQITVSNLQSGQKVELYDSSNNFKTFGTAASGQTSINLNVSSLSFPFTGYFKVYGTDGSLLFRVQYTSFADHIRDHETLRIATRYVLTPAVYGIRYPKTTVLIFFLTVIIITLTLRMRRSKRL